MFKIGDDFFRQVNESYKPHFQTLVNSGLYKNLADGRLLIPHADIGASTSIGSHAYTVIKPEKIKTLSYPYEWSFSQLKDAALLTLKIQKVGLKHGMTLKDASAYNIQFYNGKAIFIDTLSFENYEQGSPWVAYRQFCQHFLAPLALMSYTDVRLNQLLKVYIDGVPLDLASKLLPIKSYFNLRLLIHLHLHAKSQTKFADSAGTEAKTKARPMKVSKTALMGLIESLEATVKSLKWNVPKTEWGDYYQNTNYSDSAFTEKQELVRSFVGLINPQPKSIWDLGANTGEFSRCIAKDGVEVVSADIDPVAVEKNYLQCIKSGQANILPLLLDLTNPTPDIGWANQERPGFFNRNEADLILALALIHHIAISNNVPLDRIGKLLAKNCRYLVIEFVPKADSQVRRLLATREDVFPEYNEVCFEKAFSNYFELVKKSPIKNTERTLYLFKKVNMDHA